MEPLQTFIKELDEVTLPGKSNAEIVKSVEDSLIKLFNSGYKLQDKYRQENPDDTKYARHLFHIAEDRRYSIVSMVWAAEQFSPIHDHGNCWCVECVMEGEFEVTPFELIEERQDGSVILEKLPAIYCATGGTGSLIPPFEYHVAGNPSKTEKAVTLHVYGGAYDRCTLFEPNPDGSYRKELIERTFNTE